MLPKKYGNENLKSSAIVEIARWEGETILINEAEQIPERYNA